MKNKTSFVKHVEVVALRESKSLYIKYFTIFEQHLRGYFTIPRFKFNPIPLLANLSYPSVL